MIDISNFSDKCDFGDTVEIYGAENIINKYNIYIHDQILPLKVERPEDLIPYYPHIVSLMASSKENGGTIHLSDESYVDIQERESLQWVLDAALKYWRKCKREKKKFDVDEATKKVCIFWEPQEYEIEIIKRVAEKGKDATIEGIYKPLSDRWRDNLYKEMTDNGWAEDSAYRWCYGVDRWIEWTREKKKNDVVDLGS